MAESSQQNGHHQPPSPPTTLKEFLLSDVWSSVLFALRVIVFVTGLLATIPLLGSRMAVNCYVVCLRCGLFLYSLRFLQRKNQTQVPVFSRQFIDFFISEDSGHYLWYCFFYQGYYPSPLLLFPILLYTVFQVPKYFSELSKFLSPSIRSPAGRLHNYIHSKQPSILRFIASAEIFLMIVVTYNLLSGSGNLLAPVVHYYFLKWRYQSRRNPYVRIMFGELRIVMQTVSSSQKCPQFLKNFIERSVAYLSSLAPPLNTNT